MVVLEEGVDMLYWIMLKKCDAGYLIRRILDEELNHDFMCTL